MAQINEEVIRLLMKQGYVVLIGSTDERGVPNISPRFALDIIDNEKLLFADAYRNKTYANISKWPKITAVILDKDNMGGFQLKGDAEDVTNPDLIARATRKLKEYGFKSPQRVWALSVKEIYSLKPSEKSREPLASAYA